MDEPAAWWHLTGWATDLARGQALRDAVKTIPLDRLYLETDAPYFGQKNAKKRRPYIEPANQVWVARAIAELRGVDERTVVQACTRNNAKLFGLSQMA